jgi:hypothetical protein
MGPLTDILERFKDRPAEELKAYLEGYNQARIDMQNEKKRRQKETLERLRKYQSVSSQETNAAATDVSTDSHPKHIL